MTIGLPLGVCNPACFLSAAELAASGLQDGCPWTLIDPATGATIDAGIWPQGPRTGGGATVYPDIPTRDASTGHAEGDECYVTSVRTRYRFLLERLIPGDPTVWPLGFWVEDWIYTLGGSLNYLRNGTDPARWCAPNSGIGSDLVSTLPGRGWIVQNFGTGSIIDSAGDTLASAPAAWDYGGIAMQPVTNMPTGVDPGLIFIRAKFNQILFNPGVGGGIPTRSGYILMNDGLMVYHVSWNAQQWVVPGPPNQVAFATDTAVIAGGPAVIAPYDTVHIVMRMGPPPNPPAPGQAATGHQLWRADDGFYDADNNAYGSQRYGVSQALAPYFVLRSASTATSPGASLSIREFHGFTMEE